MKIFHYFIANLKMKKVFIIKKIKNFFNTTNTSYNSAEQSNDLGFSYYSSIINDKQYIYSFVSENYANNCISFLNNYKRLYNKYPDPYNKMVKMVYKNKHATFDEQLVVEEEILDSLQTQCLLNNIGLLGITNFEYTYQEKDIDKKNIFYLTI